MAAQTTPNHNEVRQEIDRITFLHNDSIQLELNSSGINCQNVALISNYPNSGGTVTLQINGSAFLVIPLTMINIGNLHLLVARGSGAVNAPASGYANLPISNIITGSGAPVPTEEVGIYTSGTIGGIRGPFSVRLDTYGTLNVDLLTTGTPCVDTSFTSGTSYQIDGFILAWVQ